MKELQAQEIHTSTETESNTTGLRELKQTFQNLSIELQQLHSQVKHHISPGSSVAILFLRAQLDV